MGAKLSFYEDSHSSVGDKLNENRQEEYRNEFKER